MRYIVLYLLLLLSSINVGAQKSDVVLITHTMSAGDRFSQTLIGTNNGSLSRVENGLHLEKPFTRKYIIDDNALKKMIHYVSENCDSVDHLGETTINLFTIRIITQKGEVACYIKEDKVLAKSYFQSLIDVLNKSCNRSDCKELNIEFKGFLRSLDD